MSESVLAEKEGKKTHESPLSSEQWKGGQVHKNLNGFFILIFTGEICPQAL